MNRSLFTLAALLLTPAILAAPAPKPQPFVSGWEKSVDPDKDCNIKRVEDTLIMELPGRDHDYDPCRGQFNAPRLLREREIEGDFVMQVRVRIDGQTSVQSTVDGRPSSVLAGFLVILPTNAQTMCMRIEFGAVLNGSGVEGCVPFRSWGYSKKRGRIVEGGQVLEKGWKGNAYLRLDRRGGSFNYSISSDGEDWKSLGGMGGLREKLKIGLAAYSTSAQPSKVIFDQFQINPRKKYERWEFVSGWGDPVDPDKDCKIKRDKDVLTIEMPGTDHDYDPIRKRFNAPRLLSDLERVFDLQVRVRIDSRPSAQSTVKDQPFVVSAGFLLIYPEGVYPICDRLEYVISQQGSSPDAHVIAPKLAEARREEPVPKGTKVDSYAVMKTWIGAQQQEDNRIKWDHGRPELRTNTLWERGWPNWPLPEKTDYVYLRLEKGMGWPTSFYISPDGEKWTRLGSLPHFPEKCKLALAAYSTSSEPSKIRFDQMKLWRPKKKE